LDPYAGKIKIAFVYGSVAKGTDTAKSDIDVMVIGDDLSYAELYAALQKAEGILRRNVNPTFLTPQEWRKKLGQKNSFASKISVQLKLFVIGWEADLSA